jgi:uncharacterized damage-inducible protein DinB
MTTANVREVDRIADLFERACRGDAWYGPSVRSILEQVDGRTAFAHPVPGAHSICEIVLHMTGWAREVARRLRVGIARDPEAGDWPTCAVAGESEWQNVVAGLDAANAELLAAIRATDDSRLGNLIGDARDPALGSGVTQYVTLHGIVQHHIYHAGQIALLKKATERR